MNVSAHADLTAADRAFARFCRDGDVAALGTTFDLTAPRLVLVAAHLSGSDLADDLVQTTFVEAIRSKDRFEPGRPVLPWLLTILTRRAANLRRAQILERRSDTALDALRDPAPGPVDAASERELHECLATALDQLEGPYREVLALRLVHGLRPVEIARALDRPLGTVHAQLHRGAERLRSLLPRSLGAALLGGFSAGEALAAVRAKVLDSLRMPPAPPVVAALALGGVIMKKSLSIAATALAALALVTLTLLRPWESATSATHIAAVAARHADSAASDGEREAGAAPPMQSRAAVPLAGASEGTRPATIMGRVVAAESDAPIAGASVTVEAWPRVTRRPVPASWVRPGPVSTAPDGTFALQVEQGARVGVSITIEGDGRAPVAKSFDRLRDGACLDVGVVPLSLGVPVSIRVLDFEGEAIAAFPIQFDAVGGRRNAGSFGFAGEGVHGYTGPDGRLDRVVAFGDWKLSLRSTGLRVEGPSVLALSPASLPRQDIVYRLVPPPADRTVSGVVVDVRGEPIAAGIDVRLVQAEGTSAQRRTSASTIRGGRFFAGALTSEHGLVRVYRVGAGFLDGGSDFEIISPCEPVPIGTRDLRVVVCPIARASLTVTVVDARSGAPLESFRASACSVARIGEQNEFGRFPGSVGLQLDEERDHPDGVVRWDGLPPGDHLVTIQPSDPALALALAVPINLLPGATGELRIELQAWNTVVARVVDTEGEAVLDAEVELLQSVSKGQIRASTNAQTAFDVFERGHSSTYLSIATDRAVTGADGTATLRAPSHVGVAALRVRGRDVATTVLQLPEFLLSQSSTFEVVVERQAVIEGRLRPLDVVRAFGPDARAREQAALYVDADELLLDEMLAVIAEDVHTGRQGGWARVDDEGRFRIGPIRPGDYVLRFDLRESAKGDRQVGFGRVDGLRRGETRRAEFDVAACAPATLRGVVLLDGLPFSRGRLEIDVGGASCWVAIDADARFNAERLLPGAGSAALHFVDSDGRDCTLVAERPVDVRTGETVDLTLRFVTRSVVLRVIDAHGDPVCGLFVQLQLADSGRGLDIRATGDDGCTRFAIAPRGPLVVRGRAADGDYVDFGRIELPDGAREHRFELTWPR